MKNVLFHEYVSMYVCVTCVSGTPGGQNSIRSPGVAGGCDLHMGAGEQTQVLSKRSQPQLSPAQD